MVDAAAPKAIEKSGVPFSDISDDGLGWTGVPITDGGDSVAQEIAKAEKAHKIEIDPKDLVWP